MRGAAFDKLVVCRKSTVWVVQFVGTEKGDEDGRSEREVAGGAEGVCLVRGWRWVGGGELERRRDFLTVGAQVNRWQKF